MCFFDNWEFLLVCVHDGLERISWFGAVLVHFIGLGKIASKICLKYQGAR